MDKEGFIKLTNNLYNLTLLFPKKEPLRFKIRELADEILKSSISVLSANPGRPKNLFAEIEKDLEVLDSFFEIAKAQNWVSPSEILKAQQEYSKVKEDLKKLPELKSPSGVPRDSPRTVPGRQEKILEILKEKEKLQVKDLKEIFPQVSKRTFRRDFEQLMNKGLIIRMGEKNNTFYKIR